MTRFTNLLQHNRTIFFMATALLSFMLFASLFVHNARAAESQLVAEDHIITLHDDGVEKGFITSAKTLREALKDANIRLDSNDKTEPGLDETLVAASYEVNIYRARPVIVRDGKTETKIITALRTPAQIAEQAGLTLHDEDTAVLSHSEDIVLDGTAEILTVNYATPFTFVFYGKTLQSYTQGKTVGEMLSLKGIKVNANDTLTPAASTPLTPGMTIKLWKNGEQTVTVDEVIKFDIDQIKDANRDPSFKEIKTPGVDGKKTVTYKIVMQDGVEVSRQVLNSVTTKEAVKQVEVVGDKQPPVVGPAEIIAIINEYSAIHGLDANKVARIAKCESGFNPKATNGIYQGLFQHHVDYWPGRAAKYGMSGASIFDARAQIVVTTAMMAAVGYGPWECQ